MENRSISPRHDVAFATGQSDEQSELMGREPERAAAGHRQTLARADLQQVRAGRALRAELRIAVPLHPATTIGTLRARGVAVW